MFILAFRLPKFIFKNFNNLIKMTNVIFRDSQISIFILYVSVIFIIISILFKYLFVF